MPLQRIPAYQLWSRRGLLVALLALPTLVGCGIDTPALTPVPVPPSATATPIAAPATPTQPPATSTAVAPTATPVPPTATVARPFPTVAASATPAQSPAIMVSTAARVTQLRQLKAPTESTVQSVAVAPDGKTLAAATVEGEIFLWTLPLGDDAPRKLTGD